MTIRARSLLNNALTSLAASGILIFSTVLIPAILVRGISRGNYDLLSIVLAALPPLLIIPQSLRSAAASQLALAFGKGDERAAIRTYFHFTLRVAILLAIAALVGIELYLLTLSQKVESISLLRLGLYCMAGHALGILAVGAFTGPASAHRDFLPDNIAKLWPGLFHLAGIATVWLTTPDHPLVWIFAVHLASSWSVALLLAVRLAKPLHLTLTTAVPHDGEAERAFWSGLRGSAWWNLTAYLATTAAVLVVAVTHPSAIVPFSIAISVLGIMSAALIAVASPISGHAADLLRRPTNESRRFFLRVNTLFQLYVLGSMILLSLLPQQLLSLWLGPGLADEVRHYMMLLLPSYALRLLSMAFTVFVMSAGRQHTLWLSPMVEAVLAAGGCLLLSQVMGVIGVPVALAVSSMARLLLTATYDERLNAADLRLCRGDILLSGFRIARAP